MVVRADIEALKQRMKAFALRVIRLTEALPSTQAAAVIGRQLLRSGTSVGANYRAACRSKSAADFINKMTIVEEEADECGYWLELLVDSGMMEKRKLDPLMREANELLGIVVASIKTARRRTRG